VYAIRTVEVGRHDTALIKTIVDIDLMTYSEQTYSRYTAGLMLRHGRNFLLTADDVPIGTCQCIRSWERPNEVVLFSMAIRPGWRGRGLGTRFMTGVLEALARQGIRSVVLMVDAENRAGIAIYSRKFAFETVEELPNEFGNGVTQLLMRRKLTDEAAVRSLP
jgi:N-alpha-acetyltransferase 50